MYDTVSGLPVDCVKIELSGNLPEFSDTLGCYQYPSGAGTYTLRASQWDYQDFDIPGFVVDWGLEAIVNIPLVHKMMLMK